MREPSRHTISRKRLRPDAVNTTGRGPRSPMSSLVTGMEALLTPVRHRPVTRRLAGSENTDTVASKGILVYDKENEAMRKVKRAKLYRLNPGHCDRPLENGARHTPTQVNAYLDHMYELAAIGNDLQIAETLQAVEVAMNGRTARALARAHAALAEQHGRAGASPRKTRQRYIPKFDYDKHEDLNQARHALRGLMEKIDVTIISRMDPMYDKVVTETPSLEDIFKMCGAEMKKKGRKQYLTNQAVITPAQAERLIIRGDILADEVVFVAVHDGRVQGFVYTINQSESVADSTDIMNWEVRVADREHALKPRPLERRRQPRRGGKKTPRRHTDTEQVEVGHEGPAPATPPYVSRATQRSSLEIVAICARGSVVRGVGRMLILYSLLHHAPHNLAGVILDVVRETPRVEVRADDPYLFQGQWERGSAFNARVAAYYAEQFRFQRAFELDALGDGPGKDIFVSGHAPYTSKPLTLVSKLSTDRRNKLKKKCIMYRPYPSATDLQVFIGRLGLDCLS